MPEKPALNPEYESFMGVYIGAYIKAAEAALKDGAISENEYQTFRESMELIREHPDIVDDEKKLESNVDLASFDRVVFRIERYFKPPS
ncbi:MAG: hypothetical protein QXD77_00630 [Candidatus Aenigmatarchaeota archaeon]